MFDFKREDNLICCATYLLTLLCDFDVSQIKVEKKKKKKRGEFSSFSTLRQHTQLRFNDFLRVLHNAQQGDNSSCVLVTVALKQLRVLWCRYVCIALGSISLGWSLATAPPYGLQCSLHRRWTCVSFLQSLTGSCSCPIHPV